MKPLLSLVAPALCVSALVGTSFAESPKTGTPAVHALHQSMQGFIDDGRHMGIQTLVARDGKVIDHWAAGFADKEAGTPMQADTICRIYSMTKIVTSACILILAEEGKLALDDPLAAHLPEFAEMRVMTGGSADAPELEPARAPITIQHLLTHTSGLIYDFNGGSPLHQLYQRARLWDAPDLPTFAAKVAALPLQHQPGTAWAYGISDDVLGAVIEKAGGESFETYLQTRLCEPLGMADTSFDVPAEKRPRLAKTYRKDGDGRLTPADPILGTHESAGEGIAAGGSGLFSTIGDCFRFAQMLANGGELDGRRVLGAASIEAMRTNQLGHLSPPRHGFDPTQGYGYGVGIQMEPGNADWPAHAGTWGWDGAATTYLRICPAKNAVAILLTQHFPFNEHRVFQTFHLGWHAALD